VSRRAQTGEPQPWKKAFSAHSSAKPTARWKSRTEYSPRRWRSAPAHKIAGVGAVADDAGEELRQAVGDVKQRRQQANIAAGQPLARISGTAALKLLRVK
jgi:hypothetical protein